MRRSSLLVAAMAVIAGCTTFHAAEGMPTEGVRVEAEAEAAATTPPRDAAASLMDASAEEAGLTFFDDFGRADGFVGNDWYAKALLFRIVGGMARQNGSGNYGDPLMVRPAGERIRDVEIETVLIPGTSTWSKGVGILARVTEDIELPGHVSGYWGSISDSTMYLYRVQTVDGTFQGRAIGSGTSFARLPAFVPYRLVMRVQGTSPVSLTLILSAADGKIVAALQTADGAADRFEEAGRVGIAGAVDDSAKTGWDSFRWTAL